MNRRWVLQLEVRDRSGILNQLTSVFAERGISLDWVLCAAEHTRPTVVLAFTAPERVKRHVQRVLARLPEVRSMTEADADAPTARAFALVAVRAAGLAPGLLEGFHVLSEEGGRIVADFSAPPAAMTARLEALERAGALQKVVSISLSV